MKVSNRIHHTVIITTLLSGAAHAEITDPIKEAFSGATTKIGFRYRLESVDQDDKDDALASTLKSRITVNTKPVYGTSLLMEVDNVTVVGADDYNDLSGDADKAAYAVVADPDYTEVNQAAIQFDGPANTKAVYGRQRILLDNQRFIGGVGWRQNEQTYDGFTLTNKAIENTTLFYGYVYNVNTILGGDADDVSHHLINLRHDYSPALGLSAYGYLLEDISDTYGIQAKGKVGLDKLDLLYHAEFATQKDNGEAAEYDAEYYHLIGGVSVSGVTAQLGYEVQTSDEGTAAFRTPLGTNHAFGGWADLFLATPATGLEDLYLSVSTDLLGPKLTVVYHDFSAEFDSTDYGSEVDISLSQNFGSSYNALIKFADFSADDDSRPDTTKLWLQLSATF